MCSPPRSRPRQDQALQCSRRPAGASGFLNLSQSGGRSERSARAPRALRDHPLAAQRAGMLEALPRRDRRRCLFKQSPLASDVGSKLILNCGYFSLSSAIALRQSSPPTDWKAHRFSHQLRSVRHQHKTTAGIEVWRLFDRAFLKFCSIVNAIYREPYATTPVEQSGNLIRLYAILTQVMTDQEDGISLPLVRM
jgi:hypothetical protein